MNPESQSRNPAAESTAGEPIRDARDLLTRLYREIGISAVAAALAVRNEKPQPMAPYVTLLRTPVQMQAAGEGKAA